MQACALLLTRAVGGRLADRRGRAVVIVPGLLCAAAAIVLLPFAYDLPQFFLSAALWGVGLGCAQPASQALLVDRARGAERGLALSTYFMGFDIGIGVGSIVLGLISQTFGWPAMWTVSALAILLGLVGVWSSRFQGAPPSSTPVPASE